MATRDTRSAAKGAGTLKNAIRFFHGLETTRDIKESSDWCIGGNFGMIIRCCGRINIRSFVFKKNLHEFLKLN
jgi:hypothetical protein